MPAENSGVPESIAPANPLISDADIVAQIGAALAEPVPVCVRNFLVLVVLPESLDNVLSEEEYKISPIA